VPNFLQLNSSTRLADIEIAAAPILMTSAFDYVKFRLRKLLAALSLPAGAEVNALYKILYDQVHDLDQAREISDRTTIAAFAEQWTRLPEGEYLLSDPWFRDNVDKILSQQELLLKADWFRGKKILDAGCGNGRWAYGFCKLGADLTCLDANAAALSGAKSALSGFDNPVAYICSPLEKLNEHVADASYDLVFCWGVLHHCVSFTKSLENLAAAVRPGDFLYLYLYGRESLPLAEDIEVFKQRVAYNVLLDDAQRTAFLLRKAKGDRNKLNAVHDFYAPLINRRLKFDYIKDALEGLGFSDVVRTISHTELFVRGTKGSNDACETLPPKTPPYWFEGRHL
jgi:2-polyprenyl-3-methyl-5-hydroxy-6-metoxy-1,4-benzoquinol methylase